MAGEFALIEHLLRQTRADQVSQPPILGPGDDCALIRAADADSAWAVTTDMLVSGVHFLDSDAANDLGWKTLAVNISDLAAMGATPRFVTLAAAIPQADANDTTWIDAFFAGFNDCAAAHGVALIGGDTTRCAGTARTFCVTALGEVLPERALRRNGAMANDDIWLSGTPGYAALGLLAKLGNVSIASDVASVAHRALHRPQPRVALGLALRGLAHSAIDVSDGLLQDLGHIAEASALNAALEASLLPAPPVGVDAELWHGCLLGGGDDYELLFTAPVNVRGTINDLADTLDLPLTRIGRMQAAAEGGTMTPSCVQVLDRAQQPMDLSRFRTGFDHFA